MLFCRPDESFLYGTVTGTVDTDYDPDWLLDGRPGFPVHRATGGLALTATALAARDVSILALINHNIAGTVAITGGVTATIPAATLEADGIYLNSFVRIATVVGATSLVMTSAAAPATVGLLYAGKVRDFERDLAVDDAEFSELSTPFVWEGDIPPYDDGYSEPRRLAGSCIVSGTGLADLRAWARSTRKGTRPSLLVPFESTNDAWLVTFRLSWQPLHVKESDAALSSYRARLEFVEIPRVRW